MPYYRSVGEVPRKRHTQFRQPDGSLYAEELMGQEGFSSDSSLLYHRHAPTAIVAAEEFTPPACHPGCRTSRSSRATCAPTSSTPAAPTRCSAGSTCWPTTTSGSGTCSPTGRPRCTATPPATSASTSRPGALRVESHLRRARRGRRRLRRSSPPRPSTGWCPPATSPSGCSPSRRPGTSARPSATCPCAASSWSTRRTASATSAGRTRRCWSTAPTSRCWSGHRRAAGPGYVYAHHPFDVVGWDGHLYPWAFSIHDFEPITGRIHQPPPVHQTFQGPNFVICSFVPRKVDYHPRRHPGAVQPPQRRLRRDALLHRRQLRGPARLRHRAGLDLAAPVRLHPRPAARARPSGRSAPTTSTSWPSWSTPSARWTSATPAAHCEDPGYAWTWARRPYVRRPRCYRRIMVRLTRWPNSAIAVGDDGQHQRPGRADQGVHQQQQRRGGDRVHGQGHRPVRRAAGPAGRSGSAPAAGRRAARPARPPPARPSTASTRANPSPPAASERRPPRWRPATSRCRTSTSRRRPWAIVRPELLRPGRLHRRRRRRPVPAPADPAAPLQPQHTDVLPGLGQAPGRAATPPGRPARPGRTAPAEQRPGRAPGAPAARRGPAPPHARPRSAPAGRCAPRPGSRRRCAGRTRRSGRAPGSDRRYAADSAYRSRSASAMARTTSGGSCHRRGGHGRVGGGERRRPAGRRPGAPGPAW